MKVQDAMRTGVPCVASGSLVRDAAKAMRDLETGLLPVVSQGRLAGVVTDRDITLRVTAEGRDANVTTVEEVMSLEFVCCHRDIDVEEAIQLMCDKRVRRLPVFDDGNRLVGMLTAQDLASCAAPEAARLLLANVAS